MRGGARGGGRRGHGGLPAALAARPRAVPLPGAPPPPPRGGAPGAGRDPREAGAGLGHARARRGGTRHRAPSPPALPRARRGLPPRLPPVDPAGAGAPGARVGGDRHPRRGTLRVPFGAAAAACLGPAVGRIPPRRGAGRGSPGGTDPGGPALIPHGPRLWGPRRRGTRFILPPWSSTLND